MIESVDRWMPYALTMVIIAGELTSLRTRPEAEQKDRGSYRVFRGSLAVAYLVAFGLFGARRLPAAAAFGAWSTWAGAAATVSGTVLRVWAMQTLGRYFTRTVHVSTDQKVIEDGPYHLVRHPSYTGAAMAALGVALSMRNALAVAIIGGAFAIGVGYRIRIEERALAETLGEPYREYMKRTKRLIPWVY